MTRQADALSGEGDIFQMHEFYRTGDEIEDLFRMTPYTWKTPRDGVDRLASVRKLKVTAQFRILAFQRKG